LLARPRLVAQDALGNGGFNDVVVWNPWALLGANHPDDAYAAFRDLVAEAPGSEPHLGAAMIVVMLLSSYLGTVAKAAGGKRQYGGVMGKADRMIYLGIAAPVAYLLPSVPVYTWVLGIMLVGVLVTIMQRLRDTYANLQSPR